MYEPSKINKEILTISGYKALGLSAAMKCNLKQRKEENLLLFTIEQFFYYFYAKIFATIYIAMKNSNPFKFGSVVDEPFFTDRKTELIQIKKALSSHNHVIIMSPRRYGKTSLVLKTVRSINRPYIFLDLQLVTDATDFATQLLKRIYRVYPFERLKQLIKNFRIVPTLNMNPVNNDIDISFQPVSSSMPVLEDVFNMIEKLGDDNARPIVILDEFQDITRLEKGLDRKLRAVIQHHSNVNYVFLGSVESMMKEIFERKKSPFYHFGQLIPLGKIPHDDFTSYLEKGFKSLGINDCKQLCFDILDITKCHPYYTQQLASNIWDTYNKELPVNTILENAISYLVRIHDMDYERLWQAQNQTDRKVLIALSQGEKMILRNSFLQQYGISALSTVFSSLKRLMKHGYIIKTESGYELDDPFFSHWIDKKRKE